MCVCMCFESFVTVAKCSLSGIPLSCSSRLSKISTTLSFSLVSRVRLRNHLTRQKRQLHIRMETRLGVPLLISPFTPERFSVECVFGGDEKIDNVSARAYVLGNAIC